MKAEDFEMNVKRNTMATIMTVTKYWILYKMNMVK